VFQYIGHLHSIIYPAINRYRTVKGSTSTFNLISFIELDVGYSILMMLMGGDDVFVLGESGDTLD
jgi:hypothetical protein